VSVDAVVDGLLAALPEHRVLVAIDGPGASGKTTFAARLAQRTRPRPVIVLHADDFFQPAPVRHARGRRSPEGFWLDAYNYDALTDWALTPLRPGGSGLYRARSFDPANGAVVQPEPLQAPPDALVLVEGTFLLRDELWPFWDCSIYIDITAEESTRRMLRRDGERSPVDRYVGGQRLYESAAEPRRRSTLVVDTTDLDDPRIVADR